MDMRRFILFILSYGVLQAGIAQQAFPDHILANPKKYSGEFESLFLYKEVPVYRKNMKEKSVFLKNGYATAILQPPLPWPLKNKIYDVKEVRLIFTKYPVDKNFWNTNYYELLATRLGNVFKLDPRLNDAHIIYSLILQTDCQSEDEARGMMHAVEIVYELGEKKPEELEESDFIDSLYLGNPDSLAWARNMDKANKFLKKSKATDTIVLRGMDLFKLKDSLLVVMDVTGSMAPYYSQVSVWAARNFYPGHYYVLFNDGGSRLLPLGETGGYEAGRVSSTSELIKLMRKSSNLRGLNREVAENDIEGILVGINAFPDNKGIVLVADNVACIRDYKLLGKINQPVHIIPCGGTTLNPQYLNLAYYTGGSVFWLDTRIDNWDELCTGKKFFLGEVAYRFIKKKQKFEVLNSRGNHENFCDSYTTIIKK
jgi:hypothetical protein